MERVLLYFVIKYKANWDKIYNALDTKEKIFLEDLQNIEENINSQYLTILNPLYPRSLKSVYKPPFVIFYEGNIELLNYPQKLITITGGFNLNSYINNVVEDFTKQLILSRKIIITGFNLGVETKVQQIIKKMSKKPTSIAVISKWNNWTPLQKELLFHLKKYHLVISEYPFMMFEDETFLEQDNKSNLLLGLSRTILFLPFNDEKYVNDLLNFALEDHKEIFAVPHQIYEKFKTNKLIKTCAKLVENIEDLL